MFANVKTLLICICPGLLFLCSAAMSQESDATYSLLLQSSPVGSGLVSPGDGVHKVQIGQTVTLSATPRPGYRFLYWLGDVSAIGDVETTVRLDSPKFVIAVFERDSFDDLADADIIGGVSSEAGGGGLYRNPTAVGSGSSVNASGSYPAQSYSYSSPSSPESPQSDDFPVPDRNEQPIPEPFTGLILGFGLWFLRISRQRRNNKSECM